MVTILEPSGGSLVVLLVGEIDHHESAIIRRQVDAAIELYRPERLVLDFSGVTFMDSSGIGLVMGRYKLMNSFGGKLEVANTPKYLRNVMRMAGLDKLSNIFEEDAVNETPK